MSNRSSFAWILSAACVGVSATQLVAQVQTIAVPAPATVAIKPAVAMLANPLPLGDVRLTGGPLKAAQDADERDLLALDTDRMLFYCGFGEGKRKGDGEIPGDEWE